MHNLVRKVGSLVLAAGALSLLLVNAALTHGCSGARRDAPVTQAGPPPPAAAEQPSVAQPSPPADPPPPAAASAPPAVAEDDCVEESPYMYATKAPVMPVRRCGKSTPNAKQTTPPSGNAQQQAP
jgi:hypothetical protein